MAGLELSRLQVFVREGNYFFSGDAAVQIELLKKCLNALGDESNLWPTILVLTLKGDRQELHLTLQFDDKSNLFGFGFQAEESPEVPESDEDIEDIPEILPGWEEE
jgi:hypothetical protein